MKKILLIGTLLLSLRAFAADESPAAAESPLAPLASLVGGTWIGPVPVPAGKPPMHIELHFTWAQNRKAIRFESAFVAEGKKRPYVDGMYGWNAAKGKIVITYMDSGGSLTEGLITLEDGVLVNELVSIDPKGIVTPIRVKVTKVGENAFTNDIYLQKDGAWAPFVNVRYERQP
jgi:hypothetical protein